MALPICVILLLAVINPMNIYSQSINTGNIGQLFELIKNAKIENSLQSYWEFVSDSFKTKILRDSFENKKYSDLNEIELVKLSILLSIYFEKIDEKYLAKLDFKSKRIDGNLNSYYCENKTDEFHGESFEIEVENRNDRVYFNNYEQTKISYVYMKGK